MDRIGYCLVTSYVAKVFGYGASDAQLAHASSLGDNLSPLDLEEFTSSKVTKARTPLRTILAEYRSMKGQSQRGTTIEILSNMIVGWFINVGILIIFGMPIAWSSSVGLIMIPVSLVRHYFLRRIFNFFHTRGILQ